MQSFILHFDSNDLKRLNTCRKILQVSTLSDICTADGRYIERNMLDGSSTPFPRSQYTWPVTPPAIPQSYWKLWRQALRRCFVQPNEHPTRLHQPLGSWLNTPSDWKALFSPSTQCLYIQQGLNYAIWLQVPTRTCTQRFQSSTLSTQTPPRDTVPCTYFHRGTYLQLTGIGTPLPVPPETSTDLLSHIKQLPSGDQWASLQIEISDDGLNLAQSLQTGNATAVSDGSYKDDYASGTSCSVL